MPDLISLAANVNILAAQTVVTETVEDATSASLLQQAGMAAILIGLAIFLIFYAVFAPKTKVPGQPEATIAPVTTADSSGFDRYIRPALRNFIPQTPLAAQVNNKKLDKTRELLVKSGNPWNIRAEEFLGIQVLFAAVGLIIGVLLFIFPIVPAVPPFLWMLLTPLALYAIPYSYHNSLRQARSDEIQKQLPEAIDLLVITMHAGKTFEPALYDVVPAMPDGLLKTEFAKVNAELNAGRGLVEVLGDFAHRSSSEDAESFAKAIMQSQKLGTEVTETLENQAKAAREAYEARVEKKIARLSSIMMIPLVFTMIPSLILIILAPTLSDLMGGLSF